MEHPGLSPGWYWGLAAAQPPTNNATKITSKRPMPLNTTREPPRDVRGRLPHGTGLMMPIATGGARGAWMAIIGLLVRVQLLDAHHARAA